MIDRLEFILALAREEHFGRAAEACRVSQPTVARLTAITRAIKASVYMAIQIGEFFASRGPDEAVAGTANHIKKFWDPRMRAAIFADLATGGVGLDANVRSALETLQKEAAPT